MRGGETLRSHPTDRGSLAAKQLRQEAALASVFRKSENPVT